jgi:hypothetical protein
MPDEAGLGRNRPVKVVMFSGNDLRPPPKAVSRPKVFDGFGPEWRSRLLSDLEIAERELKQVFSSTKIPGVVRVSMRQDAIAKSYRPTDLFKKTPIIGGEDHGQLLISVREAGLNHLKNLVAKGETEKLKSNISAIERFKPYIPNDRISPEAFNEIWSDPNSIQRMKVCLFNYQLEDTRLAKREFADYLSKNQIPCELIDYGVDGLHLFAIDCNAAMAEQLRGFVAVQSIQPFRRFTVLTSSVPYAPQAPPLPPPNDEIDYPVIGLIDTGISTAVQDLQSWVIERDASNVPEKDQDNQHGTFIGGLIVNARGLNDNDPRFPDAQAKILDVVAIPQSGTQLYEHDLIQIIGDALAKHSGKAFVWNLSFNTHGEECRYEAFSHFAMALDAMQRRYRVLFVISAGNTTTLHPWPDTGQRERILPPADSILALTVGSVAHKDTDLTLSKSGQPSPFTRMGSGPACIPKPEVAHYGGNCDADGSIFDAGIKSIGLRGMVQGIGTSYAAPLVSLVTAGVHHALEDDNRLVLSKALVIHSAALRSFIADENNEQMNMFMPYIGFGIPNDVDTILNCEPWQATMIFQPEFKPLLRRYEKAQFPMPDCLRTESGAVRCGVVMTTVYEPHLAPNFGADYSRVEVYSALGTVNKKGGFTGQLAMDKVDYETMRIKHGFKWAPVSVQRRKITRGISGVDWELQMRATSRDGSELHHPQKAICIVTIYDLNRNNPNVYNEVIQTMNRNGWPHQDIQVVPRFRIR